MSVKKLHSKEFTTYFCTFTFHEWIPLFQITNSYDLVYQWFEILKKQKIDVIGYTIMPNHLHCILHFNNEERGLNTIIGNGKRFIAYEIINRLEKQNNFSLLNSLSEACSDRDKAKGQLHKVFKPSFDAKAIFSDKFMKQKLDYMHSNPISGKWMLVNDFTAYEHSSASFYELGISKHFTPRHYKDL